MVLNLGASLFFKLMFGTFQMVVDTFQNLRYNTVNQYKKALWEA